MDLTNYQTALASFTDSACDPGFKMIQQHAGFMKISFQDVLNIIHAKVINDKDKLSQIVVIGMMMLSKGIQGEKERAAVFAGLMRDAFPEW